MELKKKPIHGLNRYEMTPDFIERVQKRVLTFDPDWDKHPGAVDRKEAVQIGMPGELRMLDWLPSDRLDCAQEKSYEKFPDAILGKTQLESRATSFNYSSVYETARAIIWEDKYYPEFVGIYIFSLVNVDAGLIFLTGWCVSDEFLSLATRVPADGTTRILGGSEIRKKSCYMIHVGHQRRLSTLRPYLLEKGLWIPK